MKNKETSFCCKNVFNICDKVSGFPLLSFYVCLSIMFFTVFWQWDRVIWPGKFAMPVSLRCSVFSVTGRHPLAAFFSHSPWKERDAAVEWNTNMALWSWFIGIKICVEHYKVDAALSPAAVNLPDRILLHSVSESPLFTSVIFIQLCYWCC